MPLARPLQCVALASASLAGCYSGLDLDGSAGPALTVSSGSTSDAPTPTSSEVPNPSTSPDPTTGASTTSDTGTSTSAQMTASASASESWGTTTGVVDMTSGTASSTTGAPGSTTGEPDTGEPLDPVAQVCARWLEDRADLSEGTWSGAVNGCVPGDTGAPGRENALRLINLYRFMAGLPAVTNEAGRDAKAQACALIMDANGQLSHDPPANWTCYSAPGAEAAGKSNIAGAPGVGAVDMYMVDPGNETTMGHRRWILSNSLGPVGLGSTSGSSCMWVIGGQGGANAAWTAWPPPGIVPLTALHVPQVWWSDVDETGWTVQSDSINVSQAQITITEGGALRPIVLTPLQSGYGSMYAVSMRPQGWVTEAGKTYVVQVNGVPQPFSYEVQVVACG